MCWHRISQYGSDFSDIFCKHDGNRTCMPNKCDIVQSISIIAFSNFTKLTYLLTYLLFLWLFPSCRVAGMTDDLSSPHRPVRLLARSQSSTLQISLACVFPSCFRSSSLPFPWYICHHHFPQYVFAISPHHMPVPYQSSLSDLFGCLRHSCCSSDVFIPDLVFACHSAHPS